MSAFFVLGNTEGTQTQLFFILAENFLTAIIQLRKIYKLEGDWRSDGVQRSGAERRQNDNLLIPYAHKGKSSDGLAG